MDCDPKPAPTEMARQRRRLVCQIARVLDKPMTALAFVWLVLLLIDLTYGLSGRFETLNTAIWIIFIVHFLLEFLIAPAKWTYLRRNWLTAIALVLPALRVLRVFRAVRAVRTIRLARVARGGLLVRVVASLNRGMKATRRVIRSSGFGYLIVLTLIVTVVGAAGMYAFESPAARQGAEFPAAVAANGLDGYGEAFWWTAMIMTTIGSEKWPVTLEGRVLGFLLSTYALGVLGYITATLASYFVGRQQQSPPAAPDLATELAALRAELAAVRTELQAVQSDLQRNGLVGRPAGSG